MKTPLSLILVTLFMLPSLTAEARKYKKIPMDAADVLRTRRVAEARISPDGNHVAYVVERQRKANDKAGKAYRWLYLRPVAGGQARRFVAGKASVKHIRWSPNGKRIGFLSKRGGKEAKVQVWAIPMDGGEATQVTRAAGNVLTYEWRPGAPEVAFITVPDKSKRQKELKEKGYGFIFRDEQRRPRELFLQRLPWAPKVKGKSKGKPRKLTDKISAWNLAFSPDGKRIALSVTEHNAIDQYYMFRKIHLLNIKSGKMRQVSDNPGKLGPYSFSPNGERLVYVAAKRQADHAVTSAFVLNLRSGKARDVTPAGLKGHVYWASWRGDGRLLLFSHEGAEGIIRQVGAAPGREDMVLRDSAKHGAYCRPLHHAFHGEAMALTCSSATMPSALELWAVGGEARTMTKLNGWVKRRKLGQQEVILHKTRDGLTLNGILVKPVGFKKGKRYPLVVVAHGGPEANFTSAWSTRYSRPAQVLAAKGYLVFMPNYRSSTGYDPDLPLSTLGEAGGKEFNDIIDAMKHLVDAGMADRQRIGLVGGSYGGYAAGWFGTRHTKWVRAVGMFVGISDLISKRGTSDIPYEVLLVHHGKVLEQMWQKNLKRSPIYWAHQSKTAFLIYGGTQDPRVPPSQSLEMFLRLKMNKHPATRLVQYPGEGHGNRKQPGRLDVLLRVVRWMDWYVKDKKPLDGPMPPVDMSDAYGLDLKAKP